MELLIGLAVIGALFGVTLGIGWVIQKIICRFVTALPTDDDSSMTRFWQTLKHEGPLVSGVACWLALFVVITLGFALVGVGYIAKGVLVK